MRIVKAEAIGHFDRDTKQKRHAIYTLDFQPGGNRLATGGHDSTVKLWNTDSLLHAGGGADGPGDEDKADCLLATLSNHTKSVNIVRWSTDGQYLASGSDDCYILVYRFTPGSYSNSSFGQPANKESWTRCATLQGHTMDVLDLDWSPRQLVASASIDNRVLIWDCKDLCGAERVSHLHAPLRVLALHQNYVKGCSFDPVGKYLATCGSDNLIILWDCDTWEAAETLSGPMKNTPDRTMFRRLSWSPDGQTFCASACVKSQKPVGMVIKRGSWEPAIDLVGHSQTALCCRFCPYVMVSNPPPVDALSSQSDAASAQAPKPRGRASPTCCVVLGDAVGVVSVWVAHQSKAVCVLRDIFDSKASNRAATDISFVRDGKSTIFAVCGMDGSVVIADVGDEFGTHMVRHTQQHTHTHTRIVFFSLRLSLFLSCSLAHPLPFPLRRKTGGRGSGQALQTLLRPRPQGHAV